MEVAIRNERLQLCGSMFESVPLKSDLVCLQCGAKKEAILLTCLGRKILPRSDQPKRFVKSGTLSLQTHRIAVMRQRSND